MLKIIFSKDGTPISDYEVEEYYQANKHSTEINISNMLVLDRFRVGVKEGDISGYTLEVVDVDGKTHTESNSTETSLAPTGKIFSVWDNLLDRLIGLW